MTETTLDEAVTAIAAATSLTPDDVRDLLGCAPEELAALVEGYKNAGKMPDASTWDVVLQVLGTCVAVAGVVIPLTGAISGVYGLAHL